MSQERIKKAIEKYSESYDKARRKSRVVVGCPYTLTIDGSVSGENNGKLVCGTDHNLTGEFGIVEPETQEFLTEEIDVDVVKSFSITGCAGDVVQAEIETYEGVRICCPVSALRVEFQKVRATEFDIKKFRDEPTEGNKK